MTTQQMEYFLALAERLNFTMVAEHFFISQPTLSRQIINLENELHTQLFFRDKGNVTLTSAGEVFYRELKNVYVRYQSAIQQTQMVGTGLTGSLNIALSEEQLMDQPVLDAIRLFHRNYPHVNISIRRCTYTAIRTGLLENYFDVADVLAVDCFQGLDMIPIAEETPCLAIERREGMRLPDAIHPEDCKDILYRYPLLMLEADNFEPQSSNPLNRWKIMMGLKHITPTIRMISSPASIPPHIAAGLGVTVVNESNAMREDHSIRLIRLLDAEQFHKVLIYPEKRHNPLAEKFIAMVVQACEEEKRRN